ncbi:AMP-binding protein [Chelativorans sp. Marseille-P2723]|uniref:class I adenylate-forming enzyme family protein n=1 Tax=Chelativorans sp. Marseille-P2723 TaxID=2709133 RepID=UPI00156E7F73|nr:AMP-binding protein [Chelativorans sp. Marseille-P2723]
MLNIAEGVESVARNKPNHPAVIEGEKVTTYSEFVRNMLGIASGFRKSGLPEGAVVGIALRDTARYLTVLYALARANIIILPIDCRWTAVEKERVARHFGASLVLLEPGDALGEEIATQTVDDEWFANMSATPVVEFPSGDGSAPLVLSLSSGTTGRPKGPLVTHRHFLRRYMTHWIDLGFTTHERYLCATPLYFGGGRMFCLSTLFCGGTVVMFPPPFKVAELAAEVERTQATSLFLVPTMIRRLLDLDDSVLAPLRRLRMLLVSGAPVTPEERIEIRKRICPNFFEYYAATEGGGISLLTPKDQETHGGTVGRPIFGVEVDVADDDGRSLPPGEVGLLRYRGPGVADSFYRDDEASRESFRDGWFYPGDLAERDEDGFITLRGRRKDMIIRGGVNIYPSDVEATLLTHPSIIDAAVAGWESREFGEEVVAFVIARDAPSPESLTEWCASQLASYKRPKAVLVVDEFPRNSFGKVLKKKLVEMHASEIREAIG